jgi:hypothetical protein
MINVVCVKWGTLYNSDYVNRLYGMVRRNLTIPFDFYCITDDPTNIRPEVIIKECPIDWLHDVGSNENQWYKECMFLKEFLPQRKTLYFDLDVVIVSSLEPLLKHEDHCWFMARDFLKRDIPTFHGAVMCFNPKYWYDFFDFFKNKVDNGYALVRGNEQPLIAKYHLLNQYKNFKLYPNEWVWSFRLGHDRKDDSVYTRYIYQGYKPPKNGIVCSFHGFPSQHQVLELEYIDKQSVSWIVENWHD